MTMPPGSPYHEPPPSSVDAIVIATSHRAAMVRASGGFDALIGSGGADRGGNHQVDRLTVIPASSRAWAAVVIF